MRMLEYPIISHHYFQSFRKLVYLTERLYCTLIDRALKMQFNEWSGNFLRPTFSELWKFSRINCAVFGQNKYTNRRF